MISKKVIGISLSYIEDDVHQNTLRADYLRLFDILDAIPVLIPNDARIIDTYFSFFKFSGFIFSGGKESVKMSHATSKRNYTELQITNFAIQNSIPILGICRGMHFINSYFGGSLIENLSSNEFLQHVNCTHVIRCQSEKVTSFLGVSELSVNSFHNDGILVSGLANQLIPLFISPDNLVEAFVHKQYKILGVQWHPERFNPMNDIQTKFLKYFFEDDKDKSYYSRCW